MKSQIAFCFTMMIFGIQNLFAQITFLGFDQQQCGLIANPGYTYDYSVSCPRSQGYRILHNGNVVFEKCIQPGGYKMIFTCKSGQVAQWERKTE